MTIGMFLLVAGVLLLAVTLIGTVIFITSSGIGKKKLDRYLKERY